MQRALRRLALRLPPASGAWLAGALLLFWGVALFAQDLRPIPELTARVIDQTGTLAPAQRQALEEKLAAFEQRKGTQMVFLMVPTTAPEDIAAYAHRVADAWKIGRREVGDGILLVVAKEDRRVRIEVARALEGAVPDLAASRIIEEQVTPRFRQGDFAGGLHAAADQLIARISGEPLPAPPAERSPRAGGFQWFDLAIFLFFAVPIIGAILRRTLGRKLGALVTGVGVGGIALLVTSSLAVAVVATLLALLFAFISGGPPRGGLRRRGYGAPVFVPGGGWAGGRSGGFGGGGFGGGFSSGGGGSFGGGGASGSW